MIQRMVVYRTPGADWVPYTTVYSPKQEQQAEALALRDHPGAEVATTSALPAEPKKDKA